jgi:hypothetical protein
MSCPILTLPAEIGRLIIDNVGSLTDIRALSLSCKALTEPCRERLFRRISFTRNHGVWVYGCSMAATASTPPIARLEARLRGLLEMEGQTRYIKEVAMNVNHARGATSSPYMQEMLAEWLKKISNLNHISVVGAPLIDKLVSGILEVSIRRPIALVLKSCTFKGPILPRLPDSSLHIHALTFQPCFAPSGAANRATLRRAAVGEERQCIAFAASLLLAAQANLTTLIIDWDTSLFSKEILGTVFLPSLCVFDWRFKRFFGLDPATAILVEGFLERHATIIDISLGYTSEGSAPFTSRFFLLTKASASTILPNLQCITACSETIEQLVPGRPVKALRLSIMSSSYETCWFPALSQSTVTVTKLCLMIYSLTSTWDGLITSIARSVPHLQELVLEMSTSLADRPLAFHAIRRFPRLRFLTLNLRLTESKKVLAMYLSSFIRAELKNLRGTALKEIIIDGMPGTTRELIHCEFIQRSWFVRLGDACNVSGRGELEREE